jgi:hypothetical protein
MSKISEKSLRHMAKIQKRKAQGSQKKFQKRKDAEEGIYKERRALESAYIRFHQARDAMDQVEDESQYSTCRVLMCAAEYEIAEIESQIKNPEVLAKRQAEAAYALQSFEHEKQKSRAARRNNGKALPLKDLVTKAEEYIPKPRPIKSL